MTLTKEAGNEFVLEAGALVLADQGILFTYDCSELTLFSLGPNPDPRILKKIAQNLYVPDSALLLNTNSAL